MAAMTGEYNYDAVMDVQWPFGHGLSYTEFAYSNFGVDRRMFGADDVLTFTVDVTNVGKVAGKEAVMLYSSDLVASLTPDVIRLRDFEKVALEPGESRTVTFAVPASDLASSGTTAAGGSRRGNSGCAAAVKRFGSVARKPKSGIHPISRKYD